MRIWTVTGSGRAARLLILSTLLSWCAVLVPGGATTRAVAAPPSACTSEQGVIVAVDFGHWGGSIQRGCDPNPSTGYNALRAAGFATQGTQHDGPAFICRINNLPSPAEDACVLTPPANAYWSYWHADPGQSGWSYGQLGAMSYQPQAGSVDAWVFGSTDIGGSTGGPSFSPSAVRADPPAPPAPPVQPSPPATEPPAAPPEPAAPEPAAPTAGPAPATTAATAASGSGATVAPRSSGGAAASTTSIVSDDPSAAASSDAPAASTSGSAATAATSASIGPTIVDVDPQAASARRSSGSPIGLLVIAGLCVVLGVAAAVVMLRRRQAR